jgi:hypothetical protein
MYIESVNFNNYTYAYKGKREGEGGERVGGGVFTFWRKTDNSVFLHFYGRMQGGFGRRMRKACIYAFRHTE